MKSISKYFFLFLYTILFKYFPRSSAPYYIGPISRWLRYSCCRRIFKYCGRGVNIERKASFGNGFMLEIGNNSGLGRSCRVPPDINIGNDVMMAPEVFVIGINHRFDDVSKPMRLQGSAKASPVRIKDDVWIGREVTITAGRKISKGSIIAARTVLTKDFPEFSIVGGNPSQLIRNRLED